MLMGLLEVLGLVTTAGEIGTTVAVVKWKNRENVKDSLYSRKRRAREFRLVDTQIQKRVAGTAAPSKMHRAIAQRIVAIARFVVYTKAFEIVVQSFVNPKSKLHQRNKPVREVAITL